MLRKPGNICCEHKMFLEKKNKKTEAYFAKLLWTSGSSRKIAHPKIRKHTFHLPNKIQHLVCEKGILEIQNRDKRLT